MAIVPWFCAAEATAEVAEHLQVRKAPGKYSQCRLAAFLETEDTKKLTDDEIIMDLYQVLVFGTYGLVTQVSIPS